jgi:homoserine dehydrogenase
MGDGIGFTGREAYMTTKILLVGFGNVGRSLVSLIISRKRMLLERYGIELSVAGVGTKSKGTIFSPEGLQLEHLLKSETFTGRVDSPLMDKGSVGLPVEELLGASDYDIMVETTPYDLESPQPALSFIEIALKRGKDVVTSNKGPIFHNFRELEDLAGQNGAKCLFEGAVMAGTPLFSFVKECLKGCEILGFEGILNGTSNYILGLMSNGTGFDDALQEARRRGYPEPDPVLDIDGWDAAVKASIIAQAVMKAPFIPFSKMEINGIRSVSPRMFEEARRYGGSLKLLTSVEVKEEEFFLNVHPAVLPPNHPLHSVSGVTNGALFLTEDLGEVCVTGAGAGAKHTAYALLRDIISICDERKVR